MNVTYEFYLLIFLTKILFDEESFDNEEPFTYFNEPKQRFLRNRLDRPLLTLGFKTTTSTLSYKNFIAFAR